MEYTKGEWKHTEDGVIVASDGKQIASVFPRDKQANTQLIASAPDLYEACKEMAKYIKEMDDIGRPHLTALKRVGARALAKAEGK